MNSMNTVSLAGSPRKDGNTSTLLNHVLEKIEVKSKVEHFNLSEIKFSGCAGCMICKDRTDYCILNDELKPVLKKVMDSDLLILSSPVYFRDVTSFLKKFIDRTFSFVKPDFMTNPEPSRLDRGKKLLFIQTQALQEPSQVFEKYNKYYFKEKWGYEKTFLIRKTGVYLKGDLVIDEDLKKNIDKTLDQIFAN